MDEILHCGKICGSGKADLNVGHRPRARRLRSVAGSINSGRHILESRCAERCANDAFSTSFRATLKGVILSRTLRSTRPWPHIHSRLLCFEVLGVKTQLQSSNVSTVVVMRLYDLSKFSDDFTPFFRS